MRGQFFSSHNPWIGGAPRAPSPRRHGSRQARRTRRTARHHTRSTRSRVSTDRNSRTSPDPAGRRNRNPAVDESHPVLRPANVARDLQDVELAAAAQGAGRRDQHDDGVDVRGQIAMIDLATEAQEFHAALAGVISAGMMVLRRGWKGCREKAACEEAGCHVWARCPPDADRAECTASSESASADSPADRESAPGS